MEVYSIDPSGENEANFTNSRMDEFDPIVSPDRKSVAFMSGSQDSNTVEVMSASDSDRVAVTVAEVRHRDVTWSPESDRIAYVTERDGQHQLMVNKDATMPGLLTTIPGEEIGDWSRNGEAVTFTVRSGAGRGLYIRNPDGVNEFRLTDQPDSSPRLSPDSKRIAFISARDGNDELYMIDVDGANLARVTQTNAPEYDISWSPNGQTILFVSEKDGNPEIYSISRNGSNLKRLTFNAVVDRYPIWSPDGDRIAFVSYLDGDADIFIMDSDGGGQRRLTLNDAMDTRPSW
jgi:Tol biopolymer transport system component